MTPFLAKNAETPGGLQKNIWGCTHGPFEK
jgi:hypothetical protein